MATQGEVEKKMTDPAMALVKLVTTAVSAAIYCANLAFDGMFCAMFGLGMLDCHVLGGMVGTCVHFIGSWT